MIPLQLGRFLDLQTILPRINELTNSPSTARRAGALESVKHPGVLGLLSPSNCECQGLDVSVDHDYGLNFCFVNCRAGSCLQNTV